MCNTYPNCDSRLFNTRNKFSYETKVSKDNAFIHIKNEVIKVLIDNEIISVLNINLKSGSQNKCYQVKDLDDVLMHLIDDKYLLIDRSSKDILVDHIYSTPDSLYNNLPREIVKAAAAEEEEEGYVVHHRMEKFDNRICALEKCKKADHPNHGSHNVSVYINDIDAFSNFVEYLEFTRRECCDCGITNAGSNEKYIKGLKPPRRNR